MNIFIDESGSFVYTDKPSSWSVIVAAACTESARRVVTTAVRQVRIEARALPNEEVKLHQLDEAAYIRFLKKLNNVGVVVFATATDAALNTTDRVLRHKEITLANIREYIPKMRYEGGRIGMSLLAEQVESLPPQLYVQLTCQVSLLFDVLNRSINYYAQRSPATLRELRWRIDQKNTQKPTFEQAFEKITPALLQALSIKNPSELVNNFDYSHMKQYEFEEGRYPDYLQTEHGLPKLEGFDLQKLIRGNIAFVDSKHSEGIQVADLLASGLRRLLRGDFSDNESIAKEFSKLMLQNKKGKNSILLTSFSEKESVVDHHAESIVKILNNGSRRMIL